ncbi:MAG: hypothetical protein ACREFM_06125 [Hypericibacter sp.]
MGEGSDPASALLDRALLQPYLEAGEKIIWTGRPGPARFRPPMTTASAWKKYKILPLLLAGVTVLIASKLEYKDPSRSWQFDLIVGFLLALSYFALLLLFGLARVLLAWRSRVRLLPGLSYALTDRRVLSFDRKSKQRPTSVVYDPLTPVEVAERADGTGSVILGTTEYELLRGKKLSASKKAKLILEEIEHARFVFAMAEKARQAWVNSQTAADR